MVGSAAEEKRAQTGENWWTVWDRKPIFDSLGGSSDLSAPVGSAHLERPPGWGVSSESLRERGGGGMKETARTAGSGGIQ